MADKGIKIICAKCGGLNNKQIKLDSYEVMNMGVEQKRTMIQCRKCGNRTYLSENLN